MAQSVTHVAEDVSHLSDIERDALRASSSEAREGMAAGLYDVVTAEALRAEFAAIFNDDPIHP